MLPYFVVCRDQNCLVGQLGGLENLRGKLEIYGLKDVVNMEEASKAKLCEKSKIQILSLHWNNNEHEREEKDYNDEDVMKGLEAHSNLKELTIEDFMGTKLAPWITMMTNLVKITLRDCTRCESFPSLGHLPKLREIYMKGMENIKVMGNFSFEGPDSAAHKTYYTTMYPSLTKLIFLNLPNLEKWVEGDMSTWHDEQSVYPKLENLVIRDCPRLKEIPCSCFPSLKKMEIKNLESSIILKTMSTKVSSLTSLHLENIGDRGGGSSSYSDIDSIMKKIIENNYISLTSLAIYGCKALKCLYVGVSLDRLFVDSCPNLISINISEWSAGLKDLEIKKCPSSLLDQVFAQVQSSTLVTLSLGPLLPTKLDEFPWPFSSSVISFPSLIILALVGWDKAKSIRLDDRLSSIFPALTDLYIVNFNGVKALPDSIANIPSLKHLSIWNCNSLECLPTFKKSHSLQQLEISVCPILKERCYGESGAEWFKIQHIPHVTLA